MVDNASNADAETILSKTTGVVREASEAVQTTTRSIANAVVAGRQPGAPLDQLARLIREMPLQSLAVAFILGFILARR
jgi:ElaB/YqjD/DUF883 family membrane-anchored ribosome-binding protein